MMVMAAAVLTMLTMMNMTTDDYDDDVDGDDHMLLHTQTKSQVIAK